MVIVLVFLVLGIFLPIIALIDILRNNFQNNDKLIWVLVILFLPMLNSILYFLIGKKQRIA